MSLKQQIDEDLKRALLGGDKLRSGTLRILKSTILNEEIARGERESGLGDDAVIQCLKKEAKKRQEAADLYQKANSLERAEQELAEKSVIETYLPAAMSDQEINQLIDVATKTHGEVSQQTMGKIIGDVKNASAGQADGADIARLVKERLQ